jgi:hypothetical protein
MKTNNLITRFLDGLTSPEEERQLRDVLEAQTSLSEEERAVLDLLRLSFPEEDTATLLTEDLSADFEDMTAQTDRSKITKRSPFFTVHSSLFIRRFTAVLSIAAILLIAFLLWPAKQETSITQPESQPVIAEVNPQPVPQPIVEEKKDETLAEVQPMPHPVSKPRPVHKAVEQEDVPASLSPSDSFDYYLAHLEAEMEALDDSVSTAHLEKLISADARLQQLVNRIIGKQTEQVMNELRKDSTANYITF